MSKLFILTLLLIISGNLYCLSNDEILWERAPTINRNEGYNGYDNRQKGVFSSDGKYIITSHKRWITVYDSETGMPIKNHYFHPSNEYEPKDRGMLDFFVNNDENIICCQYFIDSNDAPYCGYIYYEIPTFKEIGRKSSSYIFECLTSDFHFGMLSHFPERNSFLIYDLIANDTCFIDSAYVPDTSKYPDSYRYLLSNDSKYVIAAVDNYNLINISIFDIYKKKMINHYDIEKNVNIRYFKASLSENMEYLVISNKDNIGIYNIQNGELISIFNNPKEIGLSEYCILSRTNKYLASILDDDSISIYDLDAGVVSKEIDCNGDIKVLPGSYIFGDYIQNILFTKDDSKLLANGISSNYLIDVNEGKLKTMISSNSGGFGIFFTNNDKELRSGTQIWDSKTGSFIKQIILNSGNTVPIFSDKKQLVYSKKNKIYFYDYVDEILENEIYCDTNVLELSVSENGKYLGYTMEDSSFAIYDLYNNEVVFKKKYKFNKYGESFYNISLSPNNLCAVSVRTGDKFIGFSYQSIIYDFIKQTIIDQYSVDNPVVFLNSDSLLLSIGTSTSIGAALYKYSQQTHKYHYQKSFYRMNGMESIAINKNSTHFVTSGPTIWNIETGDSIQLHADPELDDMDYVAVSDNGKMLAAMSPEGRIVVWDVEKYLTPVEDNPIVVQDGIKIYPNPASDYIEISYFNPKVNTTVDVNYDIRIYNILGECVIAVETGLRPVSTLRLDVSGFPSGLYFVSMISGVKVQTKQFLLVH